jgi:hypothetical protein
MPGRADTVTLRVRVQPRASRRAIVGWADDVLRVAVTAPAVEGAANDALRRLLAETLGVAPSAISVARGERGRDKVVRIGGVTEAELRARLTDRSTRGEGTR